MDKEILNIIIQMIYNDKIDEMYEKRSTKIYFPIRITNELNFKVLADFNANYFDKYQFTLLNNALIYALKNNDKDYLMFIKENINNLKKYLRNEMIFRIKTIELAYKNLINKYYENNYKDEDIINKNKNLFKKINEINTEKEFINQTYRKILFNFLNSTYDNKIELLDDFLKTNQFDNDIIELSDSIIKKNDISFFKKMIIRFILSDNFLHIQSMLTENELDDEIDSLYEIHHQENDFDNYLDNTDNPYNVYSNQNYDEMYDDYLDDLENEIDTDILEHIKNCIDNNTYILPKDDELRTDILSNFLIYNTYIDNDSRNFDINTIEQDAEKKLVLKKINPLYKFETIDLNEL